MTKKKQTKYTQFLRGSPKNTIISYNQAIKLYENFHGMTLEELMEEALDEQTERVPSHKLKIIDRIEGFQKYLIEEKLEYNTINHRNCCLLCIFGIQVYKCFWLIY